MKRANVNELDQSLICRIGVLTQFEPSGDIQTDVHRLLRALGDEQVDDWLADAAAGDLAIFVEEVLANHQAELQRLADGAPRQWSAGEWRPDQCDIYAQILRLEVAAWRRLRAAARIPVRQ